MQIKAEFLLSVAKIEQLPEENLPEVALAGRSNVGKSSLINALTGKSRLARTSNTPGRTQTLNYYRIVPEPSVGKPFFLVDMPGYGYTAAKQSKHAHWEQLIERYLTSRKTLRGIIQLIDLRHPPQPLDYTMLDWLHSHGNRYLIVGNKADKIAKTKVSERILETCEDLNVDSRDTIAFSAETRLGRDQLWNWLLETVEE